MTSSNKSSEKVCKVESKSESPPKPQVSLLKPLKLNEESVSLVSREKDSITEESSKRTQAAEISDKDDSSPEAIPEIRIQPASLEVLASHRIGSRMASSSSDRTWSTCSSGASSDSSSIERRQESSSGDEAVITPEVRISSHRQSKSPSFVMVRTPKVNSKSPNNVNSFRNSCTKLSKRSRESLHDDRTNGESGYGSHDDNNSIPNGKSSEVKKSSNRNSKITTCSSRNSLITSTNCARSNSMITHCNTSKVSHYKHLKCCSTTALEKQSVVISKGYSTSASAANRKQHEKMRSVSTPMVSKIVKKPNPDPFKSEDSFNHYLTESSV